MNITINEKVCLIGGGAVSRSQFKKIYDGAPLFALDGGANHLNKWGMVPASIIGDLDSLEDRKTWEKKCYVVENLDQNSTDLEKCLDAVDAPLYLVFGCIDGRFDHTLEILHVMQKYHNHKMLFFSPTDVVFRIPTSWEIKLPVTTRISLFPLKKTTILDGKGWKYSVTDLTMEQGKIIGTSNENTDEKVELLYDDNGMLASILPFEFFKEVIHSLT